MVIFLQYDQISAFLQSLVNTRVCSFSKPAPPTSQLLISQLWWPQQFCCTQTVVPPQLHAINTTFESTSTCCSILHQLDKTKEKSTPEAKKSHFFPEGLVFFKLLQYLYLRCLWMSELLYCYIKILVKNVMIVHSCLQLLYYFIKI